MRNRGRSCTDIFLTKPAYLLTFENVVNLTVKVVDKKRNRFLCDLTDDILDNNHQTNYNM